MKLLCNVCIVLTFNQTFFELEKMFNLWLFITYYLRSLLKWFLRKTTGLCELQRICYGEPEGAPRVRLVEESLNLTRSQHLKRLVLHLNNVSDNGRFVGANRDELVEGAVAAVMYVKKIRPMAHPQFPRSFGECVLQIWGYRQLLTEVESKKSFVYISLRRRKQPNCNLPNIINKIIKYNR